MYDKYNMGQATQRARPGPSLPFPALLCMCDALLAVPSSVHLDMTRAMHVHACMPPGALMRCAAMSYPVVSRFRWAGKIFKSAAMVVYEQASRRAQLPPCTHSINHSCMHARVHPLARHSAAQQQHAQHDSLDISPCEPTGLRSAAHACAQPRALHHITALLPHKHMMPMVQAVVKPMPCITCCELL